MIKTAIGTLMITALSVLACYGMELLTLRIDMGGSSSTLEMITMFASGVPVLVVMGIAALAGIKLRWMSAPETGLMMLFAAILTILVMIFLFQRIGVPYDLVPRREMALGAMQILISIAASVTAGIGGIAGLIIFLVNRRR